MMSPPAPSSILARPLRLGWLEHAFVLIALLLFSQALLGRLLVGEGADADASALRLIWPPLYLGILAAMIGVVLRFCHLSARGLILWIPVILAFISVFWSLDPGMTFRRAVALTMTTAFAFYLASRYSWAELVRLLAVTFAILSVGSLVSVLVSPSFGIHDTIHPGAWRALWDTKNSLGANMARAGVIFLAAALFFPRERLVWLAFFVLALALLLLSTSKTALLGLCAGIAVMFAVWIVRQGPALTLLIIYLAVVIATLIGLSVVFMPEEFFALLGRDATLTGRTDIWVASANVINQRPWLGYGYDVFWATDTPQRDYINEFSRWEVSSAHNGWVETALSIGIPGAVVVGLTIIASLLAAAPRLGRGTEAYFVAPILMLTVLYSVSESSFLQRHSLLWVLYLVVAAKLFVGERHGFRTTMVPMNWR